MATPIAETFVPTIIEIPSQTSAYEFRGYAVTNCREENWYDKLFWRGIATDTKWIFRC